MHTKTSFVVIEDVTRACRCERNSDKIYARNSDVPIS